MDKQELAVVAVVALLAGLMLGSTVLQKTRTITVTSVTGKTVVKTVFLTPNATGTTGSRETVTPAMTPRETPYGLLAPAEILEALPGAAYSRWIPAPGVTLTVVTAAEKAGTEQASPAPSLYSSVNAQVQGVEEPDIVANNGTFIFVAVRGWVEAYRAWPPSSLALAAKIDVTGDIEKAVGPEKLVLLSNKGTSVVAEVKHMVRVAALMPTPQGLIVMAVDYPYPPLPGLGPRTWVILYDRALRPVRMLGLPGVYNDARLRGDTLILVDAVTSPVRPLVLRPQAPPEPLPPALIVAPSPEATIIAAVDLKTWRHSVETLVGVPPRALYVPAEGSIYLAAPGTPDKLLKELEGAQTPEELVKLIAKPLPLRWAETTILRIDASPEKIEVKAKTTIRGVVPKQWAMDLHKGYLRIAAYDPTKGTVDLYILDAETLKTVAKLEKIAVNEAIHAVRFIGDTLYLVTYRRVDPLFAIDLSDPLHPKVLGYLKAPGFDEYIHPLGGNMLLGIGREDGKLRITLYKLKGPVPEPIARLYLPASDKGYAWSPVLNPRTGHRAFTYQPERSLLLLPLRGYKEPGARLDGTAVIHVDKAKGALELLGIVRHDYAERTGYIDDEGYSIAPYNPIRIKAFNLTTLRIDATAGPGK